LYRFGDIELVPAGISDGDHLVHVRRGRQILGEDEEVSTQHERGRIKRSQIALQAQRQQKSKLATTVSRLHSDSGSFPLALCVFMRLRDRFDQ
jgi:hypothetical protein